MARRFPEVELSWAAGLFEGEGAVRINKPTKQNMGALLCSVTNTDRQVLDFLQDRWPGCYKAVRGLRPDQRDAWVWVVAANKAARFLRDIGPFLVTKRVRHKAAVGLSFQRQKCHRTKQGPRYFEVQWTYWMYMAHLNTRGRRPEEVLPADIQEEPPQRVGDLLPGGRP